VKNVVFDKVGGGTLTFQFPDEWDDKRIGNTLRSGRQKLIDAGAVLPQPETAPVTPVTQQVTPDSLNAAASQFGGLGDSVRQATLPAPDNPLIQQPSFMQRIGSVLADPLKQFSAPIANTIGDLSSGAEFAVNALMNRNDQQYRKAVTEDIAQKAQQREADVNAMAPPPDWSQGAPQWLERALFSTAGNVMPYMNPVTALSTIGGRALREARQVSLGNATVAEATKQIAKNAGADATMLAGIPAITSGRGVVPAILNKLDVVAENPVLNRAVGAAATAGDFGLMNAGIGAIQGETPGEILKNIATSAPFALLTGGLGGYRADVRAKLNALREKNGLPPVPGQTGQINDRPNDRQMSLTESAPPSVVDEGVPKPVVEPTVKESLTVEPPTMPAEATVVPEAQAPVDVPVVEPAPAVFYRRENPKNKYDVPWKMFASSEDELSGYGNKKLEATNNGAVRVESISEEIRNALKNEYPDLGDKEINPDHIVNSAGVWDNPDAVQAIWDNVLEPKGITKVEFQDGLMVFDGDFKSPAGEAKPARAENPATVDKNQSMIPGTERTTVATGAAARGSAGSSGSEAYTGGATLSLSGKSQETVSTPSGIVQRLHDALAPIRTGRIRNRNALGIYRSGPQAIYARLLRDLPTIAHEVGHHTQTIMFPGYTPKTMSLSSKGFPREFWRELAPMAYPGAKKKVTEGYAEFIRQWMTEPGEAQKRAPKFSEHFEATLDKYPELRTELEAARNDIEKWKGASPESRVEATTSFEKPKKSSLPTIDRLIQDVADQNFPIKRFETEAQSLTSETVRPSDSPYYQARMNPRLVERATQWITTGVTDKLGNKIGKSFSEIIEPGMSDSKNLSLYMQSVQALDKVNAGFEMPLKAEDYKAVVDKYHDRFQPIVDDLQPYGEHVLSDLKDAGVITEEDVSRMRAKWPNFSPLYREEKPGPSTGKGQDIKALARTKGGDDPIIDPIENWIRYTYNMQALANANRVRVKLADLAKATPGSGRDVIEVPFNKAPVANIRLSEVMNGKMRLLGVDEATGEEVQLDPSEMASTVFRDVKRGSESDSTMVYFRDGKPSLLQVNPDMYDAITSVDSATNNVFLQTFQGMATILRQGATALNPDFSFMKNPLKDTGVMLVQGEVTPTLSEFYRGFVSTIVGGEEHRLAAATGALHSTLSGMDRAYVQEAIDGFKDANLHVAGKIFYTLQHPVRTLAKVGEITETTTRVAEHIASTRELKNRDLSPKEIEDILVQAAMNTADGTVDFTMKGQKAKVLNKYTAFLSPAIGGLTTMARTMYSHPMRTSARAAAYVTAPTLLLYLLNRDDEKYRRMPEWQKDMFFNIPLHRIPGSPIEFLKIPRPHAYGILFGALPERILRALDKHDPYAFDKFASSIQSQFTVPVLPTPLAVAVDLLRNTSYTGAPIESSSTENLPPHLRSTDATSFASKTAANSLAKIGIEVSPAKLDYAVKGSTGGVGTYALQGIDELARLAGFAKDNPAIFPSQYPIVRSVASNEWSQSSDVLRLFDERQKLQQAKAGGMKYNEARLSKIEGWYKETYKPNTKQAKEIRDSTTKTPVQKRNEVYALKKQTDDAAALLK